MSVLSELLYMRTFKTNQEELLYYFKETSENANFIHT